MMKKPSGKTIKEISANAIPDGYSAVVIAPDGELTVIIPEHDSDESVSAGEMLAAAMMIAYSDGHHAAHLVQCVFGDDEGDVGEMKQTDLELVCSNGMVH